MATDKNNSLTEAPVGNAEAHEEPFAEDVLALLTQIDREQITTKPDVAVAVEFGTDSVEAMLAEPKSALDDPLMAGATRGADESLSTEAEMRSETPNDVALDLSAVQILFGDQKDM